MCEGILARHGAIAGKGKTVAVFGTGADTVYPTGNIRLAEQIVSTGGALIPDFPLATFPASQNFPIRNRIISGISHGVLVVEAAEYSGTRITARCALEQNREVFAVPGNVTNKTSWGPNTLIKRGAKLVASWEDGRNSRRMCDLRWPPKAAVNRQPAKLHHYSRNLRFRLHEKKIYSVLKADEALHLDEIIEKLEPQLSSSEIFAALFELELAGKVKQLFVRSF